MHQGDWLTSIELKELFFFVFFFHIPVIPAHRKVLLFPGRPVSVQPPAVRLLFSKRVKTALEPLRQVGIIVLVYLDDLLLLAWSRDKALVQMAKLIAHRSQLGFSR